MRKTITPPSKARSKGITFVNPEHILSEHQLLALRCSLLRSQGAEHSIAPVSPHPLVKMHFLLGRVTQLVPEYFPR